MSRLHVSVAVAAAALAAAGCASGDTDSDGSAPSASQAAAAKAKPGTKAARRPALCGRLRATITGRVATAAAAELSGLAISRTQRRVLWAHNDSGDTPRILAFTPSGRTLAEHAVAGAEHLDWEDMAIGPLPGPGDGLFVGDIGDNAAVRPNVTVYRMREPRPAGRPLGTVERLTLRYPDGAHDAEALLVDPASGTIVIVTKSFDGRAGIYVAGRPRAGTVTTLRAAGRLSLGAIQAITAGDVSANGRTIVLRSYDRAFVWSRKRGWSLARALVRRRPCLAGASLIREGQGETLALNANGRAFYTVPEGARPALRRYAPAR
jgi:hypothetical protein